MGVGLGLAADSAWDEYQGTPSARRYDELRDDIRALEGGTNAAFGLAGAAAITALVLYLFVDRPAGQPERRGALLGPGPAGLSVGY